LIDITPLVGVVVICSQEIFALMAHALKLNLITVNRHMLANKSCAWKTFTHLSNEECGKFSRYLCTPKRLCGLHHSERNIHSGCSKFHPLSSFRPVRVTQLVAITIKRSTYG